MPRADESSALALDRATEVQADIGNGAIGVAGPVDVNFTPEEGNQNAPFNGNIGQVAKFVFHKSFLHYMHLH